MSRSGWAALHQTLRSCRSAGTESRGDSRERAVSGGELPYDRWLWALSVRQLKQARCASAFLLARWQAKVLQDVRPRSTKKGRTTAQGGLRSPRRPRTRHVSTAIKLYSGPDYITPFQKKNRGARAANTWERTSKVLPRQGLGLGTVLIAPKKEGHRDCRCRGGGPDEAQQNSNARISTSRSGV